MAAVINSSIYLNRIRVFKKDFPMKKLIILSVAIAAISFTGLALSQADSTSGNRALQGRGIVPLQNQERETPVINNNSTTNVTQVVQPRTYQVSGQGSGQTTAQAYADCGGGTLLGGGGTCNDLNGLVAVAGSQPSGNSWVIGCQSLNYKVVFATAYAVCSAPN
jgi:hypothetical protein